MNDGIDDDDGDGDGKLPRVFLDDFNQAYLMRQKDKEGKECSFRETYICGDDHRRTDTRSPEECLVDRPLTSSIDSYGLGTVLFYLSTSGRYRPYNLNDGAEGHQPVRDHPEFYRDLVLSKDASPALPREVEEESRDPAIRAMREVTRELMAYDPRKRMSAAEAAEKLERACEVRRSKKSKGRNLMA
uniref:Protein kinase domain-containing protein n=1 Tax=Odontella aurita TaxID=265563 RepID=A0A7S4NBD9_9STRA|mmetsp:Transcript_57118/g.170238  ORF Transcript_57118/g.170238 Transcript_57118/m.170238 type:complete len:187 (+) Transcript_57118:2-562(+)